MSSKTIRLSARLGQIWPHLDKDRILSKILCGEIRWRGETLRDPSRMVPPDLQVDPQRQRFVSRGGFKLAAALHEWNWDVSGKNILDIGASTGGFTDALLQAGAAKVWAVDVGKGLLAASLRLDPRVVVLEGVGVMRLPEFNEPVHAAVADLSFRSLDTALPILLDRTVDNWVIGLVKPQFERRNFGFRQAGFNGVVPIDEGKKILDRLLKTLREQGIQALRILPSPVRGRRGNQEYLVLFQGGA